MHTPRCPSPHSSPGPLALSKGPTGIHSNTCWGAEVGGLRKEERKDSRTLRPGLPPAEQAGVSRSGFKADKFWKHSLQHHYWRAHGTLFCSRLGSAKPLILHLGFPSTAWILDTRKFLGNSWGDLRPRTGKIRNSHPSPGCLALRR